MIKTRHNQKYQHQLCVVLIELIQVNYEKPKWISMLSRDNTSPYNGEWEHDRDWHHSPESPNISHTLTVVLRDSVRCGWRKQFASFVCGCCWWRSTHDTAKRNGWLWLLAVCKMLPCYRPPYVVVCCGRVFLFICVDDQSRISVRPPKMMPKISLLSQSARA